MGPCPTATQMMLKMQRTEKWGGHRTKERGRLAKEVKERQKQEQQQFKKSHQGQANAWLEKLIDDLHTCSGCLASAKGATLPTGLASEWKNIFANHFHAVKNPRLALKLCSRGARTTMCLLRASVELRIFGMGIRRSSIFFGSIRSAWHQQAALHLHCMFLLCALVNSEDGFE